ASVASVDGALVSDNTSPVLFRKFALCSSTQFRKLLLQLRPGQLFGHAPEHGARVIFDDVADQNAEGRERARKGGHDHPWNTEYIGKFAGVKATGSTEGNRSEEHTSELQSHLNIVCRLLLEKKKKTE